MLQKVRAENEELKKHLVQITTENEEPKQQLRHLQAENEKLKQCLELMTNEVSQHKELAKMRRFCFENIHEDVHFHTGLPSASAFHQLFQYLNPDGKQSNVVYCATAQK